MLKRQLAALSQLLIATPLARVRDPRFPLRVEVGLATAFAVTLLLSALAISGWTEPLQVRLSDWVYSGRPTSGRVVIIAIDDRSLSELGPWPWPRSFLARFLQGLEGQNPQSIGIALALTEASPLDSAIAESMQRFGNVYLGVGGAVVAPNLWPPEGPPAFKPAQPPPLQLRQAAAGVGHRVITPDGDETVRQVYLALESEGQVYVSLGALVAAHARGIAPLNFVWRSRQLNLDGRRVPIDAHGRTLYNFAGGAGSLTTFSFLDLIQGNIPPGSLRDKVILLGLTSAATGERYATPLSRESQPISGLELQGQLADMLLSEPPRTLQRQDPLGVATTVLLLSLLAGLTLPHIRTLSGLGLVIIYLILFLLWAFAAYGGGLVPNLLLPPLALLLTFLPIGAFRYLSEERRRTHLTALFRRYLTPESAEQVVDSIDRGELPIRGARRRVSVLYADLRGTDNLGETVSAESALEQAGRFFQGMSEAIKEEEGTVSKPLGDALVGLWNAPLDQPDHAERAVRAALKMRRNLKPLTSEMETAPGQEPLRVGIGIATGEAVVGNLSMGEAVEYTIVGEIVTTAARVSAFANPNQILLDQATAEVQSPDLELRALQAVRVRGRRDPIPVFEVRSGASERGADNEARSQAPL